MTLGANDRKLVECQMIPIAMFRSWPAFHAKRSVSGLKDAQGHKRLPQLKPSCPNYVNNAGTQY
jgi:hypothetical protein